MKNVFKISIVMLFLLFTAINLNAQNRELDIKAEKVDGGVKIVTTENGNTSEYVFDMKQAEEYIQRFGGSIDLNIEESDENNYKITYAVDNGKTETVEFDLGSILENMSIDIDELSEDLKSMVNEIASEIEYEENIDENGNKSYKIKSSKKEK